MNDKNITPTKTLWTSKTFWVNLILALVEVAQVLAGHHIIPPEYMATITVISNIILRFFTSQAVVLTQGQADTKNENTLQNIDKAIATGDKSTLTTQFNDLLK